MPTPKKVRLADSFGRGHEKSPSMQRPALSFATVQWPLDDTMDMVKVLTERPQSPCTPIACYLLISAIGLPSVLAPLHVATAKALLIGHIIFG